MKYKNTKITEIKMPFTIKEHTKFNKKSYSYFVLGGDIGGTNTSLGIFGVKNDNPELLLSFRFKSQELKGLHYAINEALCYLQKSCKIKITNAYFAAAGVLSSKKDYVTTQNLPWDISKKDLLKKTKLKKILFMNDFEAIGYGISMLTKKDFVIVKKARKTPKAPIVVVGTGTGLGKTTLIYNERYNSYIPIPSEAGHSDFSVQNRQELELINFIRKNKKINQSISYEQVLSGQGLSNIYLFLRKSGKFKETVYTKEIDKSKNQPGLISKYRKVDKTCKATFGIFKKVYAKFARNMALDSLAFGGIYIAGGIAPKNKEIFDKEFINEFENNYKLSYVLKKIPIYLILNLDVGLLGAGFFGAKIFSTKL